MKEYVTDIPTWMSIVFTVLCCLVTMFVGLQIYQSISLEKKLRDIRRETAKQFANFDKHVASSVCLAMGKVSAHSHLIVSTLGKTSNALDQSFNHVAQAVENINDCTIKDNIPLVYKALDNLISAVEVQLSDLLTIEEDTITRVIKAVMNDSSNNDDIDKIAILNRLLKLRDKLEKLKEV